MHTYRCVRALLEHGVDVERERVGGQTALILAAEHGRAECVRALLDAGANRSHITAVSFLSHSQRNGVSMVFVPVVTIMEGYLSSVTLKVMLLY